MARNIRYLLARNQWSESELARRSGVSQKGINNILNQLNSPKLETVEAIAAAFGLTGWHLIMPNLPEELLTSQDGRDLINKVAEREAAYNAKEGSQNEPLSHKEAS